MIRGRRGWGEVLLIRKAIDDRDDDDDDEHTSVRGDVSHIMGLPKLTYCMLQETNADGNLHTFHTYRHIHNFEKCVIEL